MGNVGWGQIVVIVIVLLLIFGAKKLPEIAKSIGNGLKEFKKASAEITEPIKDEMFKVNEPQIISQTAKPAENNQFVKPAENTIIKKDDKTIVQKENQDEKINKSVV
ncbi:MAG: twin-arginine translocase TatA/TatE family subunit [Spirochaetota bacterium]|nr:twin-arginine translocase TatA/TatE family subunit [Spirochaetota bacterium]